MTNKDIQRLERQSRTEKRRIDRLTALRKAAMESLEEYELACARLRVIDKELERAVQRNDERRAAELMHEAKPLLAECAALRRREEKLNKTLLRVIEPLHQENR